MNQFLYEIFPTRSDMLSRGATEEENRIVEAHFAYLKDLTDRKVVRLAGRTLNTDSTSHGLVIFEAKTEDEARELMEEDPAVKAGVFQARLFPFRIALQS